MTASATSPYPRLFEPLSVRGRELKNRIVSTAHNPNWDIDGVLSEKHVRYHMRKARGGAGLVMTFGSASVHRPAASFSASVRLWDTNNEPALRALARGAHEHGALVMSQASHLGHRGTSLISGRPLQAPSEVPQPVRREIPHVLKVSELHDILKSFAGAARRLERCGWDGVEITSFGGHLIEQFWSPRSNLREDAYGGDFEGRMRFSVEVVEAVAEAVSDGFLVAFRLTGDPLQDVIGLDPADMVRIARRLGEIGRIDFFNISGGTGNTLETQAALIPGDVFARGAFLPLARRMKEALSIPVLAAGRILDLDQAEAALQAGDCDLVAMTRAMIADPDLPCKAQAGRSASIRPCVAINDGLHRSRLRGPAHAVLGQPRHRLAGPGRVRASRRKGKGRRRGRRSGRHRGGPGGRRARAPGRPSRALGARRRADVHRGPGARAAAPGAASGLAGAGAGATRRRRADGRRGLAGQRPRPLAHGGRGGDGRRVPVPPEARRVEGRCVTDVDLLEGRSRIEPGQSVLVYDPEGLNCGGSIANFAAEAGAGRIELATPLLAVCQDLDPTQQPAMMRRLARNRVVAYPNLVLHEPEGGRLVLRRAWSEAEQAVDADVLVFVGYRHALGGLEDELQAARPDLEVHVIGDCLAPRRLHDAVTKGVRAGNAVGLRRRSG